MRKNNLALYIAIGLAGLAVISLRTCINQQITTSLSIATLLFTIAQTVESKENYMDEDMQNAVDVANKVGNFNYNDEMMMFFKTWMKYDASNTKKKWMERTVIVINCVAFIVCAVCRFCNSYINTRSTKYGRINSVYSIAFFKYLVR